MKNEASDQYSYSDDDMASNKELSMPKQDAIYEQYKAETLRSEHKSSLH